jgi:hypothetical protein
MRRKRCEVRAQEDQNASWRRWRVWIEILEVKKLGGRGTRFSLRVYWSSAVSSCSKDAE